MTFANVATLLFASLGVLLVVLAVIGILRMPDLYSRMQASAKASTLGAMCALLAVAAFYHDKPDVVFKALASCTFLLLTAPVSAHVLSRAGILSGVSLDQASVINEMPDGEQSEPTKGI